MGTPLLQHQKRPISLVASIPKISSLNSRMTLGVRVEHWLVSNFIPTDSKKFEFQNFNSTIRFCIKNKLEFKKMRSRDRQIFEKNQFTISKL